METIQPIDTLTLLSEATEQARKWEGTLGKKCKGTAEKAFDALKAGRLDVQNPQAYVERLHPKDFESQGVLLSTSIKKSMTGPDGYAFYKLSVPVLLYSGRGAQYRLLESQFSFTTHRGQRKAGIHNIFPKAEWSPVLNWGGAIYLGLDGNLEWGAQVEQIDAKLAKLSGALAGQVKNINHAASFIKIMPFEYSLGRMEVETTYTSQTAMWRLDGKRALRRQGQVQFAVLLKVPLELTDIHLEIAVQAEPDFDWLTAQVNHIMERLPKALHDIFKRKCGLPLQAFEKWTIELPA